MNIMPQLFNAKIWDHTYFYEQYPNTAAGRLWGTLGFPGLPMSPYVSLGFRAEVDKVCTAASSLSKISKVRVTWGTKPRRQGAKMYMFITFLYYGL